MRVNLLKWFGAMLFLALLLPMQVQAEAGDGFRLDEQGAVTVVSEHAAKERISSLTFSLSVEAEGAEKVEFSFNQSSAKILEFRYDREQKELKIYVSGTEALFGASEDSLAVGQISVLDGNGNAVAADVSVVEGSLKYVYGAEQRTMEDVDMPGTVRLGGGTPQATPTPTPAPSPTPTPAPAPGNTQTPQPTPPQVTPTPQPSVPQATPTPQPPAPQMTPTPAPTPQATSTPRPSQSAGRTPGPSREPEPTDSVESPSPRPEESQEPESSPGLSPSEDEEDDIIFSWSQDEDEKKDGDEPFGKIDLVFVTAIGAILLFAGVLAMAVGILKKKPRAPQDQDSLW